MSKIRRWILASIVVLVTACSNISVQVPEPIPNIPRSGVVAEVEEEKPKPPPVVTKIVQIQQAVPNQDSQNLIKAIATRFRQKEEYILNIIKLAEKHAYPDFPKRDDILSVIAIESRFVHGAKNRGSIGLMQINITANRKLISSPFTMEENVRVGAKILNDCYYAVGRSERKAVLAYNSGLGSFRKHRFDSSYFIRFKQVLDWIRTQERIFNLV